MALILKQEANANVTTPPAGSGAVFLNASDQLTVKDTAGNISTIPTFTATNNTAVFFNDAGVLGESANLTFVKTTNTLTVTNGNLVAGGVKTDNLYYANGNPWDLSDPGGSNTQIQFNDDESFGGSSAFTFNKTTNAVSLTGNLSASNVSGGNLVSANFVSGTLTTAAQPNITSVGSLTNLNVTGNAVVGGNLTVNGNVTYVNVETFDVEDPIISVGGGPNGAPLSTNDGKDRGLLMHYYTSAPVDAYMGWDNGNAEFAFGSNVSVSSDVVTYNALGNVRASNFLGNVVGTTANFSGNITAANAMLGNVVTGNYFTGVLTYAAQPNITSVGTLQSLLVGATASTGDFGNAKSISSQDNSGGSAPDNIGLAAEAVASSANTSITGIGLLGVARANSATKGTGVQGEAKVTNTADTGAAVGVRGYATDTHAGGYNIGVLGNAIGSGVGNYAFYVQNGGIASIENPTFWDLTDNSAAALTFSSTGKANIFGIETTDNSEGIFTTGYLNVSGNATVGGIKTNNYYYANGSPVDFQQAGGSNTQVQFNDADGFGGSAAFTFNKTTNAVSMGNTLSVTATATAGNLSTGGTLGVTGNANVGNLGTSGLIVATGNVTGGNLVTAGVLSATGNANVGNLGTGGLIVATGNVTGGNLVTSGALSVTGNANVGNLGTAGLITATGNITGGNISGTLVTGTLTTAAQPNVTSLGTLSTLGVNGTVTAVAFTANTGIFTGNGAGLTNLAGSNVTGQVGNALVAGTVYTAAQPNITSVGTLTSLAVSGNATAGNVYANSGTIGASLLTGTLTTAAQPNVTSVGTLSSLNVSGNATAGNVYANSGTVGASLLTGTLTTAAQPNITSVGTLSSLSVSGNVSGGNLTTTGVLSVTGTGVSSIAGNLDMTSNTIINLATPTNPTDAATKQYVDDVAQGLNIHDSCQAATPNTLAVITGGTITYNNGSNGVGATLTTTGTFNLIDGVNVQTAGTRILVKNEANAVFNGIYTYTNTTAITRAIDYDTIPEVEAGDFVFVTGGTLYDNTGWVQTDSPTAIGTAGNTITFTQFSGAGTYTAGTGLTLSGTTFSITNTAVSAGTYGNSDAVATFTVNSQGQLTAASNTVIQANAANLSGTTLKSTVVTSSLTSVGTVTSGTWNSLVGSSATFAAGLSGANLASITGANVTGTVGSATTAGTVTTAAQPNITSVGTLTSLGVSGAVTASTLTSNVATGTAPLTVTSTTRVANLNVAYANVADNINVTAPGTGTGYIVFANATSGNVAEWTSSGITSNLANNSITATTFVGALSGAATTAGTVTTAAQPNITSVGTLTGLTVSSTITGSVSGSAGTAGTVTTAAQPNITSVGTLTGLTISGATSVTGNSALTTTNITSGANTTAGYMTGNWTLTAGSRFNATYADLAERYVADAPYEPGTVLVFGGPHEVSVTGAPASRRVAGVVSTNPAYLMNAECEGEFVVDLALMGRVPCKVMGPVVKGDLIVTSENAGYGKADNEAPAGSIIGKAVSNMNERDGIVEVLVGRC